MWGRNTVAVTFRPPTFKAETQAEGHPTQAQVLRDKKCPAFVSFRHSAKAFLSNQFPCKGQGTGALGRAERCPMFLSNSRESREGSSRSGVMHCTLASSGHASQAQSGVPTHKSRKGSGKKRVRYSRYFGIASTYFLLRV